MNVKSVMAGEYTAPPTISKLRGIKNRFTKKRKQEKYFKCIIESNRI